MHSDTPQREAREQAEALALTLEHMQQFVQRYRKNLDTSRNSDRTELFQLGSLMFQFSFLLHERMDWLRYKVYESVEQGSDGSREGATE